MELDSAFRLAVIQAWDDLQEISKLPSVRLEYQQEAGTSLDHLSVWADRPKGYQFLVCNFSATATSEQPSGAHFANGYHSEKLAQSLEFIMKNQDQFTRPPDAAGSGLVLIYPPGEQDRADAAAWMSGNPGMSGVHGRATNLSSAAAEAGVALPVAR